MRDLSVGRGRRNGPQDMRGAPRAGDNRYCQMPSDTEVQPGHQHYVSHPLEFQTPKRVAASRTHPRDNTSSACTACWLSLRTGVAYALVLGLRVCPQSESGSAASCCQPQSPIKQNRVQAFYLLWNQCGQDRRTTKTRKRTRVCGKDTRSKTKRHAL